MEPTANSPFNKEPNQPPVCRAENQHWTNFQTGYVQEIDQLLSLLDDAMAHPTCRSLRHRAIDYYSDLKQLKDWFKRLHNDLVCQNSNCTSNPQACEKRVVRSSLIIPQLNALADEFSRIKDGCYQFLSGMVQLNLL